MKLVSLKLSESDFDLILDEKISYFTFSKKVAEEGDLCMFLNRDISYDFDSLYEITNVNRINNNLYIYSFIRCHIAYDY